MDLRPVDDNLDADGDVKRNHPRRVTGADALAERRLVRAGIMMLVFGSLGLRGARVKPLHGASRYAGSE
jgi:hypothetical protein